MYLILRLGCVIKPFSIADAHRRLGDGFFGAKIVLCLSVNGQQHKGGAKPGENLHHVFQFGGRGGVDLRRVLNDMVEFLLVHQSSATAAKICCTIWV